VFIDDEADVSYFNDSTATAATTAPKISSSDSESSENDNDDDFDSSFIDDDEEKSEPSTSITKQYLRSVKYVTFNHINNRIDVDLQINIIFYIFNRSIQFKYYIILMQNISYKIVGLLNTDR
jgi:hypothetical protein